MHITLGKFMQIIYQENLNLVLDSSHFWVEFQSLFIISYQNNMFLSLQ